MSRELDARIQALLFPWDESRCRICGWPLGDERGQCRAGDCSLRPKPVRRADEPAEFSSSLDAAMAAYEEFGKKGWRMWRLIDLDNHNGWECTLSYKVANAHGLGETPALAICKAILRASEVQNA